MLIFILFNLNLVQIMRTSPSTLELSLGFLVFQ